MTIHKLGIDVYTKDKNKVIARLSKLKSTELVEDGGEYTHCRACSQILIDTTFTEDTLEDWLYKTKGINYIGVFTR